MKSGGGEGEEGEGGGEEEEDLIGKAEQEFREILDKEKAVFEDKERKMKEEVIGLMLLHICDLSVLVRVVIV